jgi:pSer/pThr/pTyr-binding forkhead associated (FHA) protein
MKRYRNTGITLVEMNEQHMPARRISVNQIPFSIGRDSGNHLVLDDLCVAKKHCQIIESQGVYILEDVGTKNKLFVNGMITDKAVLSDQLRFFIGNVEFCVEMGMSRSAHTRISQGMREIL